MALPTPDAYWAMDDASGNATDATTGARTLTKNGATIGSGAGIISTARTFTGDVAGYFSRASDSVLQTGNTNFTVFGWIKPSSSRPYHVAVCSKAGGAAYEFIVLLWSSGTMRFYVFNASGGSSDWVDFGTTLANDTWHFFCCWLDSAANKIWIQCNNGTAVSANRTVTLTAGSSDFRVGAYELTSYPYYGSIDELGWYKGNLDATQRTSLYNAGVGRTWSQAAGWGDAGGPSLFHSGNSNALSGGMIQLAGRL